MKIDPNKKYKTRDGQEVSLLHKAPDGWPNPYVIRGLLNENPVSWTDEGRFNTASESHVDLIEVREPREWVMHVKPSSQKVAAIYEDQWEEASQPWERIRVREIIEP